MGKSNGRRMVRVWISAAMIVLIGAVAAVRCSASARTIEISFRNSEGISSPAIAVEVARSAAEQRLGLMFRKHLGERDGMLFVFEGEQPRSFWMRNTYVALDMVFVSGARKVVSVVANAEPLTDTPRNSVKPAKYVVEIGSGLAEKWGVRPGSELVLPSSFQD